MNRKPDFFKFRKAEIRKRGLVMRLFKFIKNLNIDKRQRFVIAVVILSLGLFFSENIRARESGMVVSFALSVLTSLLLAGAIYKDLKDKSSYTVFILPFFYSLSFGLFYFLIPDRFLTRIIMTTVYALGLYSLFLSQNIFIVASTRTIALLGSARTVSFIIVLVSYFFLVNTIFSLHLFIVLLAILLFIFSFFFIYHSIWICNLEKPLSEHLLWVGILSLCLSELGLMLWFWPTNPTVISLFLTGFLYTIAGLSHVWSEKRLFRGVLWEYLWLSGIVFGILIIFTFII